MIYILTFARLIQLCLNIHDRIALITKASVILKSITVLLFIIQKEENLEGFSLEICWSNKDLSATQRVTAKTRERKVSWDWPWERVLNRFYGIRDFPYLKIRIRDLRTRSRRDSALKVCGRVRMLEIPLGITWLHEILSRDYGLKDPIGDPPGKVRTFRHSSS